MKITKTIKTIARGGFGRVDLVEVDHQKQFAMKVFDPKPPQGQEWDLQKLKLRFIREVKIQECLDHELFIPVIGKNLEVEYPFYLMPIADRNFQQQIEADRSSGKINISALAEILNALETLHRLGYVHRDLTPRNILLHDGRWKLSDLGLVLPPSELTTQLTSMHSAWGTQQYCAPEQAKDFHRATSSADIYSFGCIIYDCVSKAPRAPFMKHSVPGPMGIVVEKCTEVEVSKRIKTVSVLRDLMLRNATPENGDFVPLEVGTWLNTFEDLFLWDFNKADEFVRFVRDNLSDRDSIFRSMSEEFISHFAETNSEAIEEFIFYFSDWAESNFPFEYCDVIVGKLEIFFKKGSIAVKSRSAIAIAKLGSSHNRWFVMGKLAQLVNKSCDPLVAKRIAIDIIVYEAKKDFINSVTAINKKVDHFHPTILEVLSKD